MENIDVQIITIAACMYIALAICMCTHHSFDLSGVFLEGGLETPV